MRTYDSSSCSIAGADRKINNKDLSYEAHLKKDKITIKCYYCKKNYNPTNSEVRHFLETLDGFNNMYCSDKCKTFCSSFRKRTDYTHPESKLYKSKSEQQTARNCQTSHLKQLQLDEFGYNYCEKCGQEVDIVELHHTLEVAKFGLEAVNSAGHLLVCNDCHKEFTKHCRK